jgi:thioesterase domain-containing protein
MHLFPARPRLLLAGFAAAAALAALGFSTSAVAQAQFASLPAPKAVAAPTASVAATEKTYSKDASKHLYSVYSDQIHKGKLPPMLVGVAIVNTTIDGEGRVTAVDILRPPAMKEIAPWVEGMIRAAAPYPAPAKLGQSVTWHEIFLVESGGKFQVDALTEGQRSK